MSDKIAILYVDDEEKSLKYFNMLFKRDYDIFTAKNFSEVSEILDRPDIHISIVICDQRMPNKNGVDILIYIKEKSPYIIRMLTTAYSDHDSIVAAINYGKIFAYIPKPWDVEFVNNILNDAIKCKIV
jgi:response regulator RpfG family c-di-GMP phosphodiesterase